MILLGELLFLAEIVLLVYCVLNILTTPVQQVRNLPKLVWLLLVVLLPVAGGLAWLYAGRPRDPARAAPSGGPSYDRPVRSAPTSPDDDEAFLQQLRARADAQRREAERRRREQAGETPE